MPTTFYTEEEHREALRTRGVCLSAFRRIEDRIVSRYEQSPASRDKKHYRFIPYDPDSFSRGVMEAVKILRARKSVSLHAGFSFLDVGCGPGTKVVLAACVDGIHRSCGLEFDPLYIPTAQQLCGADCIFNVDGTTWTNYKKFDIIYMYNPIADYEAQMGLQRHVLKQAKRGALMLLAGCGFHEKDKITKMTYAGGVHIYQKP